jgi:hypothetical protein
LHLWLQNGCIDPLQTPADANPSELAQGFPNKGV